ncbi:MAG TPA: ABC transporter permease, partial [Gemmatimonadaceae bacterium]
MTSAERLWRVLVRLFPAETRREYGEEMLRLVRDLERDARRASPLAHAAFLARLVADAVVSAPGEHARRRRRRRSELGTPSPSMREDRMDTLRADVRYALRAMARQPAFAIVAVLTLALGIGANTAIFSLINTALLRPLPVERPEQLVSLNNVSLNLPAISYPNYRDFRDRNNSFSGMMVYRYTPFALSVNGVNERVWGYLVTGNYFEVLGVKPALGRFFTPDDDRSPGAHPIAALAYDCWQKRFAGDPQVIGKNVIVNGRNFTIIGVAPQGFYGSEIGY